MDHHFPNVPIQRLTFSTTYFDLFFGSIVKIIEPSVTAEEIKLMVQGNFIDVGLKGSF